jgi:hypothetical protein
LNLRLSVDSEAKIIKQIWQITMGINSEVEVEANLQIGPTSEGMVRLFIEAKGIEVPLDFDPDEAEEIAEEIRSAAAAARASAR